MNYTKICEIFRSLALVSGEVIMDVYNSNTFEVSLKSDDSPVTIADKKADEVISCLLYTSPSPRDRTRSRMPSSA